MFIKTTTHKRIVAEKDAEIAGLMTRLLGQVMQNKRLHARLYPFTKIRNRDAKGRFIKDTVA
jgi:hypothetical protein